MFFSRIRLKPEFFKNIRLAEVITDSAYSMHRLLWDLFPDEKRRNFLYREEIAREQLGEQAGVRGEPIYYMVSSNQPSSANPLFQVEARNYYPMLRQGERLCFELRANPVIQKNGQKHDVVMDAQVTLLKSLCAKLNFQSLLPSSPKKKDFKKVLLTKGGKALDTHLTSFLKEDFCYAERLQQNMQLRDKLEWSLKATIDDALHKWLEIKGTMHGFLIPKNPYGQYKLQNSGYRWQSIKANNGIKSGFSSVDFTGEIEVTDVERYTGALFNGVGRSKAFGCGLMLVKRI